MTKTGSSSAGGIRSLLANYPFVAVALGAVAIGAIFLFESTFSWNTFVTNLGTALIVAGVVTLGLESFHTYHLVKQSVIRQEALKTVAQEEIAKIRKEEFLSIMNAQAGSPEIWDTINRNIIARAAIRTNFRWSLVLSENRSKPGTIRLLSERTYVLKNKFPSVIPAFEIRAFVSAESQQEKDVWEKPDIHATIGDRVLSDQEILEYTKESTKYQSNFNYKIDLEPEAKIGVEITTEATYPEEGNFIILTVDPADGLTVELHCPSTYDVNYSILHPDRVNEKVARYERRGDLHKWVISTGLLPYSGMILFWAPKKITAAKTA